MKITRDVRDYAATLNDKEQKGFEAEGDQIPSSEIEKGMAQMSAKFKEMGENVYLDADKVKESNRVS
jgi:phosphomethylpyrimidine synthase